jgi:hypothetical protein
MSNIKPIFYGEIIDGKIELKLKDAFENYLKTLEGKEIELRIEKRKRNRTISQNSYYWLILTFIGDQVGEDPEVLHNTFKAMFLKGQGKKFPIVRSTTSLDTIEFVEYIEKIARKMTEYGIALPEPDEVYQ